MSVTLDDMTVGDSIDFTLVTDLKRTQMVQYAGASGDFNPLHTDERYASEFGSYPTVFAHGMLTAGLTAAMLDKLGRYSDVLRFGGRFLGLVWPGDSLTGTATLMERRLDNGRAFALLALATRNQHGSTVFEGSAEMLSPPARV
jgi:acyl dehydratase